jgi:hypothetical protein
MRPKQRSNSDINTRGSAAPAASRRAGGAGDWGALGWLSKLPETKYPSGPASPTVTEAAVQQLLGEKEFLAAALAALPRERSWGGSGVAGGRSSRLGESIQRDSQPPLSLMLQRRQLLGTRASGREKDPGAVASPDGCTTRRRPSTCQGPQRSKSLALQGQQHLGTKDG